MAIWVDDTRLDIFDDHTTPNYPANAMLANINVSSMRFNHPQFPHGHGHHPFLGHNHYGHLNRFPATTYHYNPSNRRSTQLLLGHHNGIVSSNPSNLVTASHQQIIDPDDALVNGHSAAGRIVSGGSGSASGSDPLVQNMPTINRRCVRNRCFTCLLMVMLPVGVTSTLIWAFKVQKQVNHESAIIAFMVFCFAFVFPFVLFFAAVVGHKIYKIYLIIKRHEEMQREQINSRQAAAAAAAAASNEVPTGDHYSESGSNLTIGRSSPGAGGQTVTLPPDEDPPPSYELAILCPPVDLIPKPKTEITTPLHRDVHSPKHSQNRRLSATDGPERDEKAQGPAHQQQSQQPQQQNQPREQQLQSDQQQPQQETTPQSQSQSQSQSDPDPPSGTQIAERSTTSEEPPPPYNEKLHRKK